MAGSSLGFKHSKETKALISLTNLGINHPLYGKKHLAETLAKMSLSISHANDTAIYVYSSDGKTLINNFPSAIKAGKYFKASFYTIRKYALNGLIFRDLWILSTSLIPKE
jgi:group I intron endonuclease